jgi:hypothetical protein
MLIIRTTINKTKQDIRANASDLLRGRLNKHIEIFPNDAKADNTSVAATPIPIPLIIAPEGWG